MGWGEYKLTQLKVSLHFSVYSQDSLLVLEVSPYLPKEVSLNLVSLGGNMKLHLKTVCGDLGFV